MDQDQTAPIGAVRSGSALFVEGASKILKTTFVVFGTLRVEIWNL